MKKYKVRTGENIFDISLLLFGAIDGIWDLLVCNPELTIDTMLKSGDELYYDDGFVINDGISKYLVEKKADVKNGHHQIANRDVKSAIYDVMKSYSGAVSDRLAMRNMLGKDNPDVIKSIYERADTFEESYKEVLENGWLDNNQRPILRRVSPIRPIDDGGGSATPVVVSSDGRIGGYESSGTIGAFDVTNAVLEDFSTRQGFSNDYDEAAVDEAVDNFAKTQVSIVEVDNYDEYFEDAVKPKCVIKQRGKYSKISVQMNSGGLFLVDWGDGSEYSKVTYSSSEIILDHNYSDASYHVITIYGIMQIHTLDLTDVSGVYYFIRPIAVNVFKSKINDKLINKFIYVKK